ncbi:MAG TPA: TonB-dependent receptor [Sphingomicrobium sp.]|nr:TonB-dependent receptor [Sphingomicrobium sp.]
MKLDYRQRLLATTLLVGASLVATPAFAQDTTEPETLPPAQPDPSGTPNPPDTSAVPTIPETVAPLDATPVPSNNAMGEPTRAAQDIIVTGSRIPQPNLESASPVTVVSSQEVKVSGTTRTEDLINSLPQSFAAQGSNVTNGATGAATVNLRGLGTSRTLVLINGRRMQPGDPTDPVADINFIPSQLIKRVDVLTGGASSVYGADAVAGVVNFIMDTTFTGFRIDGQASVFNHHQHADDEILVANHGVGFNPPTGWSTNGGAQDISGVFGAAFDDGRGHVQAYATYRTQDPVLESTRDTSFCALGAIAPEYRDFYGPDYGNFYCGGSLTSATGTFIRSGFISNTTGKLASELLEVQGNSLVPGFTAFNYAPYNYFQRPDERYTLGAFANYEISPGAKPYLEVMFMDDHSNAVIAPSGDFGNTLTVACDNAFLSDQQRDLLCVNGDAAGPAATFTGPLNGMADIEQANVQILRRNVEGGGRNDDLEHTDYRIVAGMRGDVTNGISYDGYYQFAKTQLSETYLNDFSVTRLGRAIDAVAVDAEGNIVAPGTAGSTIVCRSVVTGIDPNCIPYNVFETGGVDPAALAYLQTPLLRRGNVNETVAHIDMTVVGDEYGWRMPWAENGVGINVGAEYRKEFLQTTVDENFRLGEGAGQGSPTLPSKGEFDVRELFGEIQIPIVEHNFIDLFQVTAGYRYSNYHVADDSFNTDTYKIATELAPIPDIRLRASYNRAVRAPNVVELFSSARVALVGNSDPCAGGTPDATLAQCQLAGVSAAQYGAVLENPANQYNGFIGGNPNLSPEKADTYTAGVVIQPRFIPGLALTVDYFDIKIDGLISTLGYATVLNTCLNSGELCDLIHRDQFGSLWQTPNGFVTLTNLNIGGESTKGVDLQGTYSRRLGGIGTANVSFVGTWLDELSFDSGVDPEGEADGVFDCTGLYGANGCGTPNPEWRHKLRVGLTMPNGLGFSVQWRYFSSVKYDGLSNDVDLNGGEPGALEGNKRLDSRSYFDLALTARLAQRLNLRLGANNIFDTDAPLNGTGLGNGNTFPQVYDALGRYLFAGFTIDF